MFHRYLRASMLLLAVLFSVPAISQEVVTYFHTDSVGSPAAATDSYGNTVWTEDYAPYGERWTVDINSQPNRQWFTGHTEDKETGLIDAGARYYDSTTGRFLSTDPAGISADDPFTFNRYAYTNNNPYRYVDPDGRSVITKAVKLALKGGDVAATFADATQDVSTVFDSSAKPLDRVIAGVSLASEFSPISLGDAKDVLRIADKIADAKKATKNADTLKPGPFAKESIPAHRGRPTPDEQRQVNELMEKHGCHTCGTKNPGTKSGNAIADHQPAQALGEPEVFLPHCNNCKARQGGQVRQEIRKRNKP